jgi:ketosteroid isomerase-like protein
MAATGDHATTAEVEMNGADSDQIRAVKKYFKRIDRGDMTVLDLFADDFSFYFPKFGIGRGREQFRAFGGGLMASLQSIGHDIDTMAFIESGRHVVVEGTTAGVDGEGNAWSGGTTPGGRFCSVYAFDDERRITRMSIYLDPDYTGLDADRFRWGRDDRTW